jgi:hypothetical protein
MKYSGIRTTIVGLALLVLASSVSFSQRHRSGHDRHASPKSEYHVSGHHRSSSAPGTTRNSYGKIKRSSSARHEFMKETGYPHGRKGYVIDHVVPLSRGGTDAPSNMQWQTKEEAKQKDKWERGPAHSKSRKYK